MCSDGEQIEEKHHSSTICLSSAPPLFPELHCMKYVNRCVHGLRTNTNSKILIFFCICSVPRIVVVRYFVGNLTVLKILSDHIGCSKNVIFDQQMVQSMITRKCGGDGGMLGCCIELSDNGAIPLQCKSYGCHCIVWYCQCWNSNQWPWSNNSCRRWHLLVIFWWYCDRWTVFDGDGHPGTAAVVPISSLPLEEKVVLSPSPSWYLERPGRGEGCEGC